MAKTWTELLKHVRETHKGKAGMNGRHGVNVCPHRTRFMLFKRNAVRFKVKGFLYDIL